MHIVVGSAHRDNQRVHHRYFEQLRLLRAALPYDKIRIIAAEGDSKNDDTRQSLLTNARRYGFDIEFSSCTHGRPMYGSVEHPDRMRSLSIVGNSIFACVNQVDDVLIYVESDLMWNGNDLADMAKSVFHRQVNYDVYAPIIMAGQLQYDVWGYRDLAGLRWSPHYPYHEQLRTHVCMEMSSVGSCLVMRSEVARVCRIRDDNALVGWCKDARERGYRIGATRQYTVRHPL